MMFSYLKKRYCVHPSIGSVHQLKDESLGVRNERCLWVGVCKKCGADVDLSEGPFNQSSVCEVVAITRKVLLLVAFVTASAWIYYLLK